MRGGHALCLSSAGFLLWACAAHAACSELEANWASNHAELGPPQVSAVLFSAADQDCLDLARAALASGGSLEARDRFGNAPLAHAARAGSIAVEGLYLDHGAAVDARNAAGGSALFLAAERDQAAAASALLAHKADPNLPGRSGVTPLVAASFRADDKLAALLLAHGADPRLADATGKPAIVYAAARGDAALVAMLLGRGIDVNARYANQLTVLMWAAGHADGADPAGALDLVGRLLDAHAEIDARDNRGRTALMIAAERGHAAIAKRLLARGADPRLVDRQGHSAADLASDPELRRMLAPA